MQQHATPKAHSHTFDAFNILWKVCVLRSPSHVYFCCLIDESGAADEEYYLLRAYLESSVT